jgi:hypothetical protein
MRPAMSVRCLAVAIMVAACSGSTSPNSNSLVGLWRAPAESLHPTGSMTRMVSFSESGSFTSIVNSYGIYGGSPGKLAAYIRMTGSYKIDSERLTVTVTRIATWDSFYGETSPETVQQVNTSAFDNAKFVIVGDQLVIDYVTYPADAPVPTSQSYFRVGLD